MKILNKIKSNKIMALFSIMFVIWLIFLIIFGIVSTRDPVFIEAISQADVSSEYTSTIPLLRYFLEPIIGLSFMLADVQFGLLFGIIFIFLVLRVTILVINRTILKNSIKHKIIFYYVENVLDFFLKAMLIILAVVLVIFLIGYFSVGFLFINHNWQTILQWAIFVGVLILGVKTIYNVYIFVHPKKSLKSKKIAKLEKDSVNIEKNKNGKKYFKIIGNEIKYFFVLMLLSAIILVSFLGIKFPTQVIQTDLAEDEVIFDFHVHTTMSDGFLTPEERVEWYREQGIDGAAFSDHQNTRGSTRAKAYVEQMGYDDFTVIYAQEYTCEYPPIHLNVFGIKEDLTPIEFQNDPYKPNCMNVSDMIKYVKNHCGYVIVNHYYAPDNPEMPFNYSQLRDWGVDGFEIANYGEPYPDEIRLFCIANNLTMLSTTDEHCNRELVAFMKIKLKDPNNRSVHALFEAMENTSNYEAIYIDRYSQKVVSDIDNLGVFNFIGYLLNYFYNLDIFQSLSWIIWSCLGFILIHFIIKGIKKMDVNKLKEKVSLK
ncbi:MAG: hypothetical protein EU551_02690 [Promethearchaeota archaeon]|nr:MAG: hypothetical protein EU551_02690 [Candidatus Lokiarchaeota archaeon]